MVAAAGPKVKPTPACRILADSSSRARAKAELDRLIYRHENQISKIYSFELGIREGASRH
jgi:hypothetical protein